MAKIGIYITTNEIKKRGQNILGNNVKNDFESKKYYGLKSIINEIDSNNKIKYISKKEINEVDFILFSIISYYDMLSLIKDFYKIKKTSLLIVGGPYCFNLKLLRNIADIVVLGRGENLINDIFDNFQNEHIYKSNIDFNLENKYSFRKAKKLIEINKWKEKSVGCHKKCFFCFYAWKSDFYCNKENYSSSFSNKEDFIQFLEIGNGGRLVSALDGLKEKDRFIVNKKITNEDIKEKLIECKESKKRIILKLYNIIGYPWSTKIDYSELINIVKDLDNKDKLRITLYLTHTHFIPKIFTPMEDERLNLIDFRYDVVSSPNVYNNNGCFKISNNISVPSVSSSIEEYILDRSENIDNIYNIICSGKYYKLNSFDKKKYLLKFFKDDIFSNLKHNYIEYSKGFDFAKKKYEKNKKMI